MTTGRCASHGCANSIAVMNLPDNPKLIACLLVNHLRAKVEMRRQSHLKNRAVLIVDRSRGRPRVIDHFPAASSVDAGMTLEQALSRQVNGIVLEADEAAYCRVFDRMLLSLQGVSDRVEGAELGTAYARLDGLEDLYGGETRLVRTLLNAVSPDLAPRVGVGAAKFPAYVAARTSQPLGSVKVPREVARFLAPHPVELLPIPRWSGRKCSVSASTPWATWRRWNRKRS